MPLQPNSFWLRYIAPARVVLAAAALILSYLLHLQASSLYFILIGAYLGYTILAAARVKGMSSGTIGLLALFGDTIFFLVLAFEGADLLLWIAAAFYLFLLAEALVFYTSVELGVIVSVCTLFCAVLSYPSVGALLPTVVVAGALALGVAVVLKQQRNRVEQLTEKLIEVQKSAEKAVEMERQRIASDFHDGPLQSFISLQMRLDILRKILDRDLQAGLEDLRQLQVLAGSQIRDLRAFLHSMRPVDVDGGNLVATARRATESFQKETGIPVAFTGSSTPVGLPQEMALEVLQLLRESLHNIQKHAGATRVAVALEKTGRGLEISVDDNGHGFNFAGTYTLEELELLKLGPASLKRRARALNAELVLESRPGRGAGLRFRIPLP